MDRSRPLPHWRRNNPQFTRRKVPYELEPTFAGYTLGIKMREREIARLQAFRGLVCFPDSGEIVPEQDRRHAQEDIEFIRGEIAQIETLIQELKNRNLQK